MARPNPLDRQRAKNMGASGDSAEDLAKAETIRKGRQKDLYAPAPNQPQSPLKGIMGAIKKWRAPKAKPAAPKMPAKSPYPTLTPAARDSLSIKYLGR